MGVVSDLAVARLNSAETNGRYRLRAAVQVRLIEETGNYEVVGECGHRLTVVWPGWEAESWERRIAEGRRHRKRCTYCPK